jgi:hypothetical protein
MIIIRKNQTAHAQAESTVIEEYQMAEQSVSGAIARIDGRYPQSGFARNEVSRELAYIIGGTRKIIQSGTETKFNAGDVIFIDRGEPFAWLGTFEMFMVTAPKFNPQQHKIA